MLLFKEDMELLNGCSGCSSNTITNQVEDDPAHKRPTQSRSCTDLICLLLLCGFCIGWTCVAIYALSSGNLAWLMHPVNSEGEICDHGNQSGKPNLLYFDLTRCAGVLAAVGGCSTPQVCVEECPKTYWTSGQGKSSGLELFCKLGTNMSTVIYQLVTERSCPAYLLPSISVLGRCVPVVGMVRGEEAGKADKKMNAIKTEDGEVLQKDSLMEGVEYVMGSIDTHGYGPKIVAYLPSYWWIVLIFSVLVMTMILKVLIKLATKSVLWASIVLCPAILVALSVSTLTRYNQMRTWKENDTQDDTFLPTVITSMSSYWYNQYTWLGFGIIIAVFTLFIIMLLATSLKKIKDALELIIEAIKTFDSKLALLSIPIGQFMAQVILIFWFVNVVIFLASSGLPEYRVVEACSSETCINKNTEKMFILNDICDPTTFAECTGCPRGQCLYHKFKPYELCSWLQIFNLAGIVWLLSFVQAFGYLVMAGVFLEGRAEDLSGLGVWSSFKRTCRYHLGTVACAPLIYFLCWHKSVARNLHKTGYVFTAVYGNSFWMGGQRSSSLFDKNSARMDGLDSVAHLVIFTVRVFLLGLVAVTIFAIFSTQVCSSLEVHLLYQIVPILIITLGLFAASSGFFSVYSVALDSIIISFLEDLEKNDDKNSNPSSVILGEIFELKDNKSIKIKENKLDN